MSASPDPVLDGWVHSVFTAAGCTHPVYRKGSGPAVIVVHEIPGITPAVTTFAEEVVAAGFTVAMPLLVGDAGRSPSPGYLLSSVARVCVSKEFTNWAVGTTSPVIGWLRALARSLTARWAASVSERSACASAGASRWA